METDKGHKNEGEILQTVLSLQQIQETQMGEVVCWQENEETQRPEQVIWQIETSEGGRQSVLQSNNSGILHHLPITYLTSNNQNVAFSKMKKPMTCTVNDHADSSQKAEKSHNNEVILQNAQKIVVVQQLDTKYENNPIYGQLSLNCMGEKIYKVDGKNQTYFSLENADPSNKTDCNYELHAHDLMQNNAEVKDINDMVDSVHMDSQIQLKSAMMDDNIEVVTEDRGKNEIQLPDLNDFKDGSNRSVNDIKGRRAGRIKIEKKVITRKKRLKRKSVSAKNKLKSTKNIDTLSIIKARKIEKIKTSNGNIKEKSTENVKKNHDELTKLEDSADQVADRFKIGCECVDYNCFEGLNAEKVFRHRLNIADLTKAEHDMYLMGVIMTSMQNPEETCRHKERLRIRSTYVYQGKRVCLTAFLYLEHVTLYQMKRLRKHLKYHGVSPRIHGNRGRKPPNTLSLDTYQHATMFVQRYIEEHCVKSVPNFTIFSTNKIGSSFVSGTNLNLHDNKKPGKEPHTIKIANKMNSYHLPPYCTKKTLHDEYKAFCEGVRPDDKIMQYSTFTSFLKKQFPNVKFQKMDKKQEDKVFDSRIPTNLLQNKFKTKRLKKTTTESELKLETPQIASSEEDSVKTGKIIPQKKRIQLPQPQLIVTSKSNSQNFIKKGQIISHTVIKAPQIVLNGQHVQIANSNQLQMSARLPEQVLVGNQIVNVNHSPSYTQHVYIANN